MNRYSIIQDKMDRCYICGDKNNTHIHEVFFGTAHRQLSIKYGLCICLCAKHHNMSNEGIHFNYNLDLEIKKKCQLIAMSYYNWTIDEWFKIFRRSWI